MSATNDRPTRLRALLLCFLVLTAPREGLAVEPGLPSKSSIQVMIARAIGAHDPDPSVRNPDWLAERFVGPAERGVMAGTVWETALDLDWREAVKIPELDRTVRVHLIRTRFIDEKLTKALANGATQVVIMGAGFDSRAYRFRPQYPAVRFIEVDYGPTQEYKRKRVAALFGDAPPNVRFAPIDFTKDKLGDVLTKAGYRASERTFFIWEGVPYYLPEAAVRDTLQYVAKNAAAGSSIVTDFVYQSLIDKIGKPPAPGDPPIVRSVLAMTKRLAESGEPWLSGIPDNHEREYLAAAGLELIEALPQGSAEVARRYRTRRDGSLVGAEPASHPSVGCFVEAALPVK
jgi:methyltransferase (TIGR00027 family)